MLLPQDPSYMVNQWTLKLLLLPLALKPQLSKWLNILFGTIYTSIMLLIAITSIAPWWTFYVFLALVESCITLLIVWYAWKWPERNSTPETIT